MKRKTRKKEKGWVNKKLTNERFRKAFENEYAKLSIGEQLAALRIQANLTQAQVAKRVGTTASAISRYENAEYDRYELQTLRRIAEACGGKIDVIVVRSDGKKAA